MNQAGMKVTINRKTYDTSTAVLLASNRYWDGNNFERGGRNTYLYRTAKGNYFRYTTTMWQGEFDTITPIDAEEAEELYNELREKEVKYKDAFPDVTIEEA